MDFIVFCLFKRVNSDQILEVARFTLLDFEVRNDVFLTLRVLGESHRHESEATSLKKWMNGIRRFNVSLAISRAFWRGSSTGYRIDTFGNLLTSLNFVSIAESKNLSYVYDCCNLPSVACRFELIYENFLSCR